MSQQINLLSPILLAPRRYFSALAMVQGLGLVLAGAGLLVLWMLWADARMQRDHQTALELASADRARLSHALAQLPRKRELHALVQEVAARDLQLQQDQRLLQVLTGNSQAGGRPNSELLRVVANSLPEPVWVHGLSWDGQQLELLGGTLDTSALRLWLEQLGAQPLLAGKTLIQVQVQALSQRSGDGSALLTALDAPPAWEGRPIWAYQVRSAPPVAASAASGTSPANAASGVAQ